MAPSKKKLDKKAAPVADPDLFAIDTTGSQTVRSKLLVEANQGGVSRLRKGATKPLTSTQIIQGRNGSTTEPLLGRKRKASSSTVSMPASKKVVTKEVRKRLEVLGKMKDRRRGLHQVDDAEPAPVGRSYETSQANYDAWAAEPAPLIEVNEHIADVVVKRKPQVSSSLLPTLAKWLIGKTDRPQ